MMHDLHWKTGRQAASLMQHVNQKELKMLEGNEMKETEMEVLLCKT